MVVHYRCIFGKWYTFPRDYMLWTGLDLRGESYWIVPGTVGDDT